MNHTIPQFDESEQPSPQLVPEFSLLAAIIELALHDLNTRQHREDARAFIESTDFALFCDWLGLDVEAIRQKVLSMCF